MEFQNVTKAPRYQVSREPSCYDKQITSKMRLSDVRNAKKKEKREEKRQLFINFKKSSTFIACD